MFDLPALEDAARLVHAVFPPTPQYAWPLLAARTGAEVWVKHENHTPTGAFKVRGGLTYLTALKRERPQRARRHLAPRAATTASASPMPARAPACR